HYRGISRVAATPATPGTAASALLALFDLLLDVTQQIFFLIAQPALRLGLGRLRAAGATSGRARTASGAEAATCGRGRCARRSRANRRRRDVRQLREH